MDDLARWSSSSATGRSYANGKQMFQVASGVAGHRLNTAGESIGPDLATLDPKMTAVEVLKNVLDPSAKMDDKYRTNVFELKSGKVVSGLVLEETNETVKVVENPLAATVPVVVPRARTWPRR